MELLLLAVVALLVLAFAAGLVALGRWWESERQRDERHRLRNELGLAVLLLAQHGVAWPPESKPEDAVAPVRPLS